VRRQSRFLARLSRSTPFISNEKGRLMAITEKKKKKKKKGGPGKR
jgi:hypothetical protein